MLTGNSYGKSRIRVGKVTRTPTQHTFKEFTVASELFGDFETMYTKDDNRLCIATDSQKNIVYALASEYPCDTIESFGLYVAQWYLNKYAHVSGINVTISEDLWNRVDQNGRPHNTAFVGGSSEKHVCVVSQHRGQAPTVSGGIADLQVLRTAGSEFANFLTDDMRLLPDSRDRIFSTMVVAKWKYNMATGGKVDFAAAHERARKALLGVFANHYSISVQATQLAMAQELLKQCPEIDQVRLDLPNKHYIPFNLKPLGRENKNEIFICTDDPHGQISATVTRPRSNL
jgi:urate oxidase